MLTATIILIKEAKFECDKLAKFKVQNMKLLLTKPFLTTLYLLSLLWILKSQFLSISTVLLKLIITDKDLKDKKTMGKGLL